MASQRLRASLLNATGLILFALSCALAVAVLVAPPLAQHSFRAPWLLLVGVAAYALSVLAYRVDTCPEARPLLSIRRSMAERLAELRAAPYSSRSALIPVLAEAVRHMDTHLVPTFRGIVERHDDLSRHLVLYESGKMSAPDPENLDRLRRIYARQQEALDACVRQAANAYATLIALLQEADDAGVIEQARLWTSDLNDIYDGLAEVLSGVDPYEQAMVQLRLDSAARAPVQPLMREALQRVEPELSPPAKAGAAPVASRSLPDGLTQREAEVLALLAKGLTSREIAQRLVVTLATVSRHIANIYNKIDARGRADATRYAMRHGIFPDDDSGSAGGPVTRPPTDLQSRGGATA